MGRDVWDAVIDEYTCESCLARNGIECGPTSGILPPPNKNCTSDLSLVTPPGCGPACRCGIKHVEDANYDRWSDPGYAARMWAAAFKDMRPVTGLRVGAMEVGAEHEAAIDELAKWCVGRHADRELVNAARSWMLDRLDVPAKEAASEQ